MNLAYIPRNHSSDRATGLR